MHVATSPDTVMIINQNSQLTTHGPSRTEIRQEPSDDAAKEEKSEAKKAQLAHPRRLSPSLQQPRRHHEHPDCVGCKSQTSSGGRAEDGDRSFHRPTGEDLRWQSSR